MRYEVEVAGRMRQVDVRTTDGLLAVTVDGRTRTVDAASIDACTMSLIVREGERAISREVAVGPAPGAAGYLVDVDGLAVAVMVNGARRRTAESAPGGRAARGTTSVIAPMPGRIVRVLVGPGDRVASRQPVVVIEAMKMENELRAGREGTVAAVPVEPGQSVEAGAVLLVIEPPQT